MGFTTNVSVPNRKSKQGSTKRLVRLGIDVPLLLITMTLVIFGLLMVFSASHDFSNYVYGNNTYVFNRQLAFLGLASVVAIFLTFFNYHMLRPLALPMLVVTLLALMVVLILGQQRLGAVRSFLSGSYQPSELAKIVVIIYLSVWLYAKKEFINQVGFGLLPLGFILGIVGGLIMMQPDLSAVLTIIMLGGLMFFLAGGELRQIIVLVVLAVIFGWLLIKLTPTGSSRVTGYLEGLRDPTLAPYHVRRSLEAFVKGGWFGVGIGKAETKLTGLPVPHTDSIFSVIGEETGIFGATSLVILYGLFLWRGIVIARKAPDLLGSLLAGGLSCWIVLEALINMLVIVGLLPFAGNALPLISAGGSNLMVVIASVGIIMNVSRLSYKQEEEENRRQAPVVNYQNRRPQRNMATKKEP